MTYKADDRHPILVEGGAARAAWGWWLVGGRAAGAGEGVPKFASSRAPPPHHSSTRWPEGWLSEGCGGGRGSLQLPGNKTRPCPGASPDTARHGRQMQFGACGWVEARGGCGGGWRERWWRGHTGADGWCEVLAYLALYCGQMAGVGRPMAAAARLGHTQGGGGANERPRWRGALRGGARA